MIGEVAHVTVKAETVSNNPVSEAICNGLTERFQLLVESISDHAVFMIDPAGHVANWNAGAERIKGYSAAEIVGEHFERFYTAEDRAADVPRSALELARGHRRYHDEGWRVRKDGTRFWASVIIGAVRDDSGKLLGFANVTRDITARYRIRQALIESERQFRLLVNGVREYALCMLDPAGIVTTWNVGAERTAGYNADEIVGQHFSKFYLDADRAAGHPEESLRIAAEDGRFEAEAQRVRKDGSVFWANVVIDPIRDETGQLIGFAAITRDITERRKSEEHLSRLARSDALTGLPNRHAIKESLEEISATDCPGTLFVVDLDNFKDVNDALGHMVGDGFIRAAGERIRQAVGEPSVLGRLGGDKFAILLPGNADPTAAVGMCQQLIAAFREPLTYCKHQAYLGASIGIAFCPNHGANPEELLTNADLALYQAKAEGRSRYSLFVPSLRHAALARQTCEQELRHAIQVGELELFYQPLVRIPERRIIGAEGLLRWRHPQHGLIAPGALLPVLERSSLQSLVDSFVIGQACAHAATVRSLGLKDYRVSVNIFGKQLQNHELVGTVVKALESNSLSPDALELEITENVILKRDDAVIAPLQALRALGVRIAFDDYGTGYASLSLLKRFPLTRLKIDQTFVRDMCSDKGSAAVVVAMIHLGKSFDLEIVAEGIEHPEQERQLCQLGCTCGQGYFYWRPMPAEDLMRLLIGKREILSTIRQTPEPLRVTALHA
jgi:diguanylate cyclase (GGDEF)-like protein/PAS domain S-box-containing protein